MYEPYKVEMQRHHASWVACMKMQVAADQLSARRPHVDNKPKRSRKRKVGKVDGRKLEIIAGLERAEKASRPAPDGTLTPA